MPRHTLEQRLFILKTHYKTGECFAETMRKLRTHFGRHNVPPRSTVKELIKKFEHTYSLKDNTPCVRQRSRRSVQNIAAVSESVTINPKTSICHRAQQLNISRATVQQILMKDLHLHAYKIQLTQELLAGDLQ